MTRHVTFGYLISWWALVIIWSLQWRRPTKQTTDGKWTSWTKRSRKWSEVMSVAVAAVCGWCLFAQRSRGAWINRGIDRCDNCLWSQDHDTTKATAVLQAFTQNQPASMSNRNSVHGSASVLFIFWPSVVETALETTKGPLHRRKLHELWSTNG